MPVIAPHLHAVGFDGGDPKAEGPQPFDWRRRSQFTMSLDNTGTPANAYHIPGGVALETAAEYYALLTGDFNVTLDELEQSGWWPYATIPAEMDRALVIAKKDGGVVKDKYRLLKGIGSANWINRAKGDVLSAFYTDFFYRIPAHEPADRTPVGWSNRTGIPPEMPKWQPDHSAAPVAKTAADLPRRRDNFWVNAYSGVPMRVSEEAGDLKLSDISYMSQMATFIDPEGNTNWGSMHYYSGSEKAPKLEVPTINWAQEKPLPWTQRYGKELPPLPQWLKSGPDSPEYQQHTQQLLARYKPLSEHGSTNELPLDTSAERAPLEELACPTALSLAAQYYAITTADTEVSLRDIVDAGFWPYDTFPTWLDLTETLYDFPRSETVSLGYSEGGFTNGVPNGPRWTGKLATDLGTPQWLLWRRAEILNQVHAELFFNPRADYLPAEVDPQSADLLPKFAAFWVNPVASAAAGRPVAFTYGPVQGQLSTLDVNLLRPLYEGAHIRYAQQVPLINLADKSQYASGGPPSFVYRERNLQGLTEMARAWHVPAEAGGGLAELRWRFSQPTSLQEHVLVDVGWDKPQPQIGIDGKPVAVRAYRYGIRSYELGEEVNGGVTSFWPTSPQAQLVYDSAAPLMKRYGLTFSHQPRDYTWIVQMVRHRGGGVQLPGGRAGIDPLAEPIKLEIIDR